MAQLATPGESSQNNAENAPLGVGKPFGFLAVLVFGVSGIGLAFSGQIPWQIFAGIWPGVNLPLVLLTAILLSLFVVYTYAAMGTFAPRMGADYVIGSRVLNKPLAFASSWTFVILSALAAGALLTEITHTVLPAFLQLFTALSGPSSLLPVGAIDSMRGAENISLISTILVIAIFLLMLLPSRTIFRVLTGGVVLSILSWLVIAYQLASAPIQGFQVGWNRLVGPGTYASHFNQAIQMGMKTQPTSLTLLLLGGVLLVGWLFFGSFIATFFAGDVQRPEHNLIRGSAAALAVAAVLFLGVSGLLLRLVPAEWLSAESFLYHAQGVNTTALPWIQAYATAALPSLPLLTFLCLGWVASLFCMALAYLYYCSRILLAWAADHQSPEMFGMIHPGLHSPLIAVLVVCILAEFGVIDASQGGIITNRATFLLGMVISQLLPLLAVTLLPFLQRDWFKNAAGFARMKIGSMPIITVTGAISVLCFAGWIIANALYSGGIILPALLSCAILFGLGIAWYVGMRALGYGRPHPEKMDGETISQS